jgi:hypothetical protein
VILLTLLRIACRLAMFAACAALVALLIEPSWHSRTRTLELRVRRGPEIVTAARSLADRVFSERERDLPEVASGKDRKRASADELTDEDRRLLQRLVEEKLRE